MPKILGIVARMEIFATRELAEAVRAAMGDQTYDDIHDKGGPSSPTLRKILSGDGSKISRATARNLDDALRWPRGTVAATSRGTTPAGLQMRASRERSGLSRSDFAQALEIGTGALGLMESGATEVPPSVRKRVLALFGSDELLAELSRRIQDRAVG